MAMSLKLNNGRDFPVLGLGTWQAPPGEVGQAVQDAIDAGYRHIDCAAAYENEAEVGAAINDKIKEGVVTRDDLFITSKLWNTCHRPDLVVLALKKTLADLDLEYIDLYIIHWAFGFKEETGQLFPKDEDGVMALSDVHFLDTWPEMEKCVELGLTRSIGVSNFNSIQLQLVLDIAKIKPVVNQVECNPYLNQKKLIQFCKERDIIITAYCPLANPSMKKAPEETHLLEDPKLIALGEKYNKTVAQVILRYLIDIGTNPIPKSVHKNRILENFQVFDFKLAPEDIDYLNTFNDNSRICSFSAAKHSPFYSFDVEF